MVTCPFSDVIKMRWRGVSRHTRHAVKYALLLSILVNVLLVYHRYQLKYGRLAVSRKETVVHKHLILPRINTTVASLNHIKITEHRNASIVFEDKTIQNDTVVNKVIVPKPLRYLKRVLGHGYGIFLFSAVISNSSHNSSWDKMAVQGWVAKNFTHNVSCCLHYSSGELFSYPASSHHWYIVSKMVATQFFCPIRIPLNVTVSHVSIADKKHPCHHRVNWYLVPHLAYKHDDQIAVCAKLAYGNLSSDDILSWFEIHRRLGVSKVLTFTYDLNPEASRVLDYYRAIGIAEVVHFELPETGDKRPTVGVKNPQAWNDEQVCVYDCLERLKGYKYVLTIDFDEYLIPKTDSSLLVLFNKMFRRRPAAAGFLFLVQLHITDWEPNQVSEFKVARYITSTKPMLDRLKHVVRPERVRQGGLATHGFRPAENKGFKKFVAGNNEAVLHHFRSCRKDWEKREKNFCMNLERYPDTSVADKIHDIENDLLSLNKTIFEGS